MNKRIVVIVAIIVVILAAALVFFLLRKNSPTSSVPVATSTGEAGGATFAITSSTPAPTSTTITLGTREGSVVMNNFYQNAQTITTDGQAVIMTSTDDYAITYNVSDSSFAIVIESTPLESARQEAESAFLNILGVSRSDACKLTVYEGVPVGVSDEYPGENFPLSFCGGPPTL